MKKHLFLSLVLCLLAAVTFGQNRRATQAQSYLVQKTWKIVRVDGRVDDRFQMGEKINFHHDGKFYIESVNDPYSHGTWVLDGKYLVLQYQDAEHHATMSERMQVKKIKADQLVLKTYKLKEKGWEKHTLYLR
ncbi:hypothetical protein [Persicobacter psychrovividus]|uniref:Lipocalin-like domain-containing protein n=1 Tax=Persicobacter psychrovividus TaxID=387638 RepID=A0ABN6L9U0_9BACT|nr:hypothetical protein PEPS_22660 [Persicobacter psychrovividus]